MATRTRTHRHPRKLWICMGRERVAMRCGNCCVPCEKWKSCNNSNNNNCSTCSKNKAQAEEEEEEKEEEEVAEEEELQLFNNLNGRSAWNFRLNNAHRIVAVFGLLFAFVSLPLSLFLLPGLLFYYCSCCFSHWHFDYWKSWQTIRTGGDEASGQSHYASKRNTSIPINCTVYWKYRAKWCK